MRPDWLSIPGADPGRLAIEADETRSRWLCFLDDPDTAERLREDPDSLLERLVGWRDAMPRQPVDSIEIIDPGTLIPFGNDAEWPMDRHRLDVALSVGRHAAERAKLAGYRRLVLVDLSNGPSVAVADGRLDWNADLLSDSTWMAGHCAYGTLLRLGRFETAALAGALIASAQMGMRIAPRGSGAVGAARLAVALNRRVGDWLAAPKGRRAGHPGAVPVRADRESRLALVD